MKENTRAVADINKVPPTWGILLLPISMSRIDNSQSPQEYERFLKNFASKVQAPKVGIHFLYTEGLYMNFEERAFETKNAYIQKMVNHKNGVKKFLKRNFMEFQIESAFSFESWFQMCLGADEFASGVKQARSFYEKDAKFRELIESDANLIGRELDERQLQFFLEEFVLSYLAVYGKFDIANPYVAGREEWYLLAYPGRPFLSQIYFVQKNILGFEKRGERYIGHYDISKNKYYDFLGIDVDSFKFED